MARISKNIAFTVPPTMADEFERLANEEQSTKSELFRRIFRFYQASRKSSKKQDSDFDAWVEKTIIEAVEEKKTKPISDENLSELDEKLLRYGAEQSKALGITSEEQINDIVYEERQKHRQTARRS